MLLYHQLDQAFILLQCTSTVTPANRLSVKQLASAMSFLHWQWIINPWAHIIDWWCLSLFFLLEQVEVWLCVTCIHVLLISHLGHKYKAVNSSGADEDGSREHAVDQVGPWVQVERDRDGQSGGCSDQIHSSHDGQGLVDWRKTNAAGQSS